MKGLISLGAFLALAAGCSGAVDSQTEKIGRAEEELYILSTAVWNSPNIPVCWDTPGYATQKGWVRDQVRSTWETETGASFYGWGDCTASSSGIRITVADTTEAPHTSALGTNIDGVVGGMVLNFTFQNWGKYACVNSAEFCIREIAAHEFGHALGFAHEQNRTDTPSSCTATKDPNPGDTMYGAWDLMSIMNYCNPTTDNGGVLSMTDIAGASKYYGGPHTISSIPWGDSQISFYRGSDDTIHETFTNDSGGSISGSLGGYVTSDISAVAGGTTRWDLFYRTADGSVWQVTNNSGTTTWTPLGGVIMGSPSAVSWGPNRFDIFVRGTDYNLWHQAYDGTWHGWERLPTAGYALGGDPVAVSWGSNRLDVFARAWDGSLLHEWWNGAWGTESLGGKIYGVPAPIVTGSGKLYVYVRGTDDAIWEQSFDGTSWSGYFGPRMGNVLSNPVAGWTGSSTVVGFRGLDPTLTTTALNIYEESPIDWRGRVNWAFGLLLSPHSFSASPSMVQVSTDVDFFVRGTDSALWRLAADTNTDSSTWTWASFGGSLH